MNKIMVIDCNNLGYRSFYSTRDLSNEEKSIGVIFGFLNQLLTLQKNLLCDEWVFCWDSRKYFRKIIFPPYKSKRHTKTEEEKQELEVAYKQFTELRVEILPDLGFKNIFMKTGFEADDLIGKIAKSNRRKHIYIVSTDEDFYQLVTRNVEIYNHKKFITYSDLIKEYKITGNTWAKVKALSGCKSDEVPGIERVGDPTAIKYLVGTLKKGKIFDRIEKEKNKVLERNLPLVTLPFPLRSMEEIEIQKSNLYKDIFFDIFEEFNFQSFLRKDKWLNWIEFFNLKDRP